MITSFLITIFFINPGFELESVWCEGYINNIDVVGDVAIIYPQGGYGGMQFYLLSPSEPPEHISSIPTAGIVHEKTVIAREYCFVIDRYCSILKVDISDPYQPRIVERGSISDNLNIRDFKASHDFLFILNSNGLNVISIDDCSVTMTYPDVIGQCMAYFEGYLYVGNGHSLYVYDISDPSNPPILLNTISFSSTTAVPKMLLINGNNLFAYMYQAGLIALDLHDPINPVELSFAQQNMNSDSLKICAWGTTGVIISDQYRTAFYFLSGSQLIQEQFLNGLGVWDIATYNDMILTANSYSFSGFDIPVDSGPVWTHRLRGASGSFKSVAIKDDILYSSFGSGSTIFDISTGKLEFISSGYNSWDDIQIHDNFMFTIDWTNRLRNYDISVPDSPELLFEAPHSMPSLHNIFLKFPYLYSVNSRLYILDVSEPSNPTVVETILDGFDDSYSLTKIAFKDSTLYHFNRNLSTWDITNPVLPTLVNQYELNLSTSITRRSLAIKDDLLIVGCSRYLLFFDIHQPSNPIFLTQLSVSPPLYQSSLGGVFSNDRFYFGGNDLTVIEYSDPLFPRITEIVHGGSEDFGKLVAAENGVLIGAGSYKLWQMRHNKWLNLYERFVEWPRSNIINLLLSMDHDPLIFSNCDTLIKP